MGQNYYEITKAARKAKSIEDNLDKILHDIQVIGIVETARQWNIPTSTLYTNEVIRKARGLPPCYTKVKDKNPPAAPLPLDPEPEDNTDLPITPRGSMTIEIAWEKFETRCKDSLRKYLETMRKAEYEYDQEIEAAWEEYKYQVRGS